MRLFLPSLMLFSLATACSSDDKESSVAEWDTDVHIDADADADAGADSDADADQGADADDTGSVDADADAGADADDTGETDADADADGTGDDTGVPDDTGASDTGDADTGEIDTGMADTGSGDPVDEPATCEDVDVYEPNDTPETSHDLGDMSDGDDPMSFAAQIGDSDDVDWLTYSGTDDLFGIVAPRVEFEGDVRVCLLAQCEGDEEETEVECSGTATYTMVDGFPGCCDTVDVSVDLGCPGLDDGAQMYIQVTSESDECEPYALSYEF